MSDLALDTRSTTSTELVEAFAFAVARPGTKALLLDQNNLNAGWATIPEAVASGSAFAVQVQPDLLAVDCDDPSRAGCLREAAGEIEGMDFPYVLLESGRRGHLHLFARISDTQLRHRIAQILRGQGIDIRTVIRPPLSPHRSGLVPRLLWPGDETEALEALRTHELSERVRRLIEHGDNTNRYPSDSEVFQAIALNLHLFGYTESDLLEVAMDPANRGTISARKKKRNPVKYVQDSWRDARNFAEKHPHLRNREQERDQIAQLWTIAEGVPWTGKAGLTDHSVLTNAHIPTAYRLGRRTYGLSSRQAMELAGVKSRETMLKAQKRLIVAGWLRPGEPSGPRAVTQWSLLAPEKCAQIDQSLYAPTYKTGLDSLTFELWLWTALGKGCERSYSVLAERGGPIKAAELSRLTGLHSQTTRNHLRALEAHGMAERTWLGWMPRPFDPDRVARDLGSFGALAELRERHQRERRNYIAYHLLRYGTDPYTGEIISEGSQ